MKRHLFHIGMIVAFSALVAPSAQMAAANIPPSEEQLHSDTLPQHQHPRDKGSGERPGCAARRDYSLFASEQYDCSCSGTPLVSCWVSSDDCPPGFYAECYESTTFKCGCYCRY